MHTPNTTSLWKIATIAFASLALLSLGSYLMRDGGLTIEKYTTPKLNVAPVRVPIPSMQTRLDWVALANSAEFIVGVNIAKVDFKQNTRTTTFRYFKINEIEESWSDWAVKNGSDDAPLFNQDEESNQLLVKLINGNFTCVKVMETAGGKLIPKLKDHVTDVCIVPIPPGFGDFVGFANIFLSRAITKSEAEKLAVTVKKLSHELYDRDVLKHGLVTHD